jgi:hypothetical protein
MSKQTSGGGGRAYAFEDGCLELCLGDAFVYRAQLFDGVFWSKLLVSCLRNVNTKEVPP